jgi:hypothetical protein
MHPEPIPQEIASLLELLCDTCAEFVPIPVRTGEPRHLVVPSGSHR